MTVYRLIQHFSNIKNLFYGVDTTLSVTELNLHIAYLQCIRGKLPQLYWADDVLSEKSCMVLLHDLYGMCKVPTFQPYIQSIDLLQNWINYCLCSDEYHDSLNEVAVKDASLTILNLMAEEVEEKIVALKRTRSDGYAHAVMELERLGLVISGERIPPRWEWQDINSEPLDCQRFISFPFPELLCFDE